MEEKLFKIVDGSLCAARSSISVFWKKLKMIVAKIFIPIIEKETNDRRADLLNRRTVATISIYAQNFRFLTCPHLHLKSAADFSSSRFFTWKSGTSMSSIFLFFFLVGLFNFFRTADCLARQLSTCYILLGNLQQRRCDLRDQQATRFEHLRQLFVCSIRPERKVANETRERDRLR